MKKWFECTPAQKIERWENVLRVLTKMTPHARKKHFDMGRWGEKTDCGTVGCAAGHCALDPWFRRRGLSGKFVRRRFDGDEKSHLNLEFPNLAPWEFFGYEGDEEVFCNKEFAHKKGAGVHAKVVRAVKDYIKELKEDA